jgi:hypothetical protein
MERMEGCTTLALFQLSKQINEESWRFLMDTQSSMSFFFFTNFHGCCFTNFLFFPLLQIPFCFTNSSMAAVLQKRKLVVDSAGFIDGVAFNASTECDYFTIPQVIAEVRDKKSQDFALVENFTVRTPGADAMKAVTSFSKKV